jgi:hypothetical protein
MKIEVNISKGYFLLIIGLFCLLLGGMVYAFGGTNPESVGHSAGEINFTGAVNYSNCTWVGGNRCSNCRYNWYCPNGTIATGVAQKSTGERHIDYSYVYCCQFG